jgi:hypothetical protein
MSLFPELREARLDVLTALAIRADVADRAALASDMPDTP